MSIEPMEKIPLFYNYNRSNSHKLPRQRHRVIAAAYLPTDVSTEIIKDVDLQENNVPVVHYVSYLIIVLNSNFQRNVFIYIPVCVHTINTLMRKYSFGKVK